MDAFVPSVFRYPVYPLAYKLSKDPIDIYKIKAFQKILNNNIKNINKKIIFNKLRKYRYFKLLFIKEYKNKIFTYEI
jgi:hypothetical protein